MNNSNILNKSERGSIKNKFIVNSTYKNRLSSNLQIYMMHMIGDDNDYYPIAYSSYKDNNYITIGNRVVYYINVNTFSKNFNKIYFAFYCKWNDPTLIIINNIYELKPCGKIDNNQIYQAPDPDVRGLFKCFDEEDYAMKQKYGIEEYGG
jgi:hypothetical protein